MANTDFRTNVGFFDHPKTLRLQKKLGSDGVIHLQRLWAYTAVNKPKGIIDRDLVEDASRWTGEEGLFLKTLLDLKFLDVVDDSLVAVHDWEEHNHWAFNADERSEEARRRANIRWHNSEETREDASSNASSNAVSNAPFLSSPSPTSPDLSYPDPTSPDLSELQNEPPPLPSSPPEGGKRRAKKQPDPVEGANSFQEEKKRREREEMDRAFAKAEREEL